MKKQITEFRIRMPTDRHAEIVASAQQNQRSTHAEYLARISEGGISADIDEIKQRLESLEQMLIEIRQMFYDDGK